MNPSPDDLREDIGKLKLGIIKQIYKSIYVFTAFFSDTIVLFILLLVLYLFEFVAPNPPVIVTDPIGVRMTGQGLSVIQFSKGLVILWVIGNSVKLYLRGAPQIQLESEPFASND